MSTASVPNTFASAVTATGLQLDQNYNTIVAYLNEPLNRTNYATDSGNTNTIVLTFLPAVSAYSAGLEITFKAANTNSGAAVINANALGNQNFVQPGGGALASGQIQAGGVYKAAYDGTSFIYIGQNVLAAAKADMQTATSAITFVSPVQMINHFGVSKAWASFNGTNTGTITAISSYNISTIVRRSAGSYSITLTTPFPTMPAWIGGARGNSTVQQDASVDSTTATIYMTVLAASTGAGSDSTYVSFIAFGTS